MEEIEILLDENKECSDSIKIIHLLRDPRGKTNSHLHLPGEPYQKNSSGIKNLVDRFCDRIMQDIEIRTRLELKHPNSLLEKLYEDIADNLLVNVEHTYNFIWGTKPPEKIYSWIQIITDGNKKETKHDTYNLKRANSSQTVRKWLTEMDSDLTQHIENSCRDLISYLKLDFVYK